MAILDTSPQLSSETLQGAESPFFYDQVTEGTNRETQPYLFSEGFWLVHSDLLTTEPRMVAQYGLTADSEEPVGMGESADRVMTLAFDAQWPEGAVPTTGRAAAYLWQLTHTQEGGGRIVRQLQTTPHGVTASRRTYDVQGVDRRTEPDDPVTLAQDITTITKGEWMQEHVAKLRHRQELARAALSRFIIEGLPLSDQKYQEELKRHEHNIARVVFLAMPFPEF